MIYFDFSTNDNESLNTLSYDCSYNVPADGVVEGYTGIHNCSCSFCDSACPAPNVNGDIGFFDGCDGVMVGIVYAFLVLFSIVLWVFRDFYEKKRIAQEKKEKDEEDERKRDLIETTTEK